MTLLVNSYGVIPPISGSQAGAWECSKGRAAASGKFQEAEPDMTAFLRSAERVRMWGFTRH